MYSTAKELHIGIDMGLQRINSVSKQSIKPEEKDWVLNEVMYQLINSIANPSPKVSRNYFEMDQKAIDLLESLKVTDYSKLPIIKENSAERKAYAKLPKNYLRMIGTRAVIKPTPIPAEAKNGVITYYKVFMPQATVLSHYTNNFTLTIQGNTLFNIAATGNGGRLYPYADFNSHDSRYIVIKTAIEALNEIPGIDAYWTNYGNIKAEGSFIILVDPAIYGNGVNQASTLTLTLGGIVSNNNPTIYGNYNNLAINTASVTCRIVASDDIDNMNDHIFARTSKDSPLVTIGGNHIELSVPKNYTALALYASYYRKPRSINYILNRGCEISSSDFQNELVNKAVQKIAARIEDKSYPQIINENLLLE